jgi:YHS domain-containing protein
MQVRTANAPARTTHDDHTYYFCADRCRERFDAEPDRYTRTTARS